MVIGNSRMKPLEVCILAAGLGTRMKSDRPKALQSLAGRPLLAHQLDEIARLQPTRVHAVIGQGADMIRDAFSDNDAIHWVLQEERLGTGHAMMQALPHVSDNANVLVILGDVPLISVETMQRLVQSEADLTVLSVLLEDPSGYGRIVREESGQVLRIVEQRDADDREQAIKEINTGLMFTSATRMSGWLSRLNRDNDQNEYLLTDLVGLANDDQQSVEALLADNPLEVTGINSRQQLAAVERDLQERIASDLMSQGVQLADPERIDVRGELKVGRDVFIDVGCVFEGRCQIEDGVSIGPYCVIRDSFIGQETVIKSHTVLDGATVSSECSVGPYARLRPEARLEAGAAIGNFVEVKKSVVGAGSKASHLAYLGDSTIGEGVNIGAGTITCNYDGVNKHQTHIGDGVFVGSNTSLVAPVSVEDGANIGAGSVITTDVPSQSLAIGRGRQRNIEGWATRKKNG